jgi:hypothetical protein
MPPVAEGDGRLQIAGRDEGLRLLDGVRRCLRKFNLSLLLARIIQQGGNVRASPHSIAAESRICIA